MNFIKVQVRGMVHFDFEVKPASHRKFVRFAELLKEMCLLFNESQNGIRKIELDRDKRPPTKVTQKLPPQKPIEKTSRKTKSNTSVQKPDNFGRGRGRSAKKDASGESK